MSQPISLIERERKVLRDLTGLVAEATEQETEIEAQFRVASRKAEEAHQETLAAAGEQFEAARQQAATDHEASRQRLVREFAQQRQQADKAFKERSLEIDSAYADEEHRIKSELREARWEVTTVYEAAKNKPHEELEQFTKSVQGQLARLEEVRGEAGGFLKSCRMLQVTAGVEVPAPPAVEGAVCDAFAQQFQQAETQLGQLTGLAVPRMFRGLQIVGVVVLLTMVATVAAGTLFGWSQFEAPLLTAIAVVIVGSCVTGWLYLQGKRQAADLYEALLGSIAAAGQFAQACLQQAAQQAEERSRQIRETYERDAGRIDRELKAKLGTLVKKRDNQVHEAEVELQRKSIELDQSEQAKLQELEKKYDKRLTQIKQDYDQQLTQRNEAHQAEMDKLTAEYESAWKGLRAKWEETVTSARDEIESMNAQREAGFPGWQSPAWEDWSPSEAIPRFFPFGKLAVDPAQFPGGLPQTKQLNSATLTNFDLPAVLSFPDRLSLLLKAQGQGKTEAVRLLQTIMLRMMTALPPGKVRFTIIDPVGLGENFAAFMNLADYNESLVNSRIWTESHHIEQRLTDLTAHMENVIQKYLRNQFQTIEEYNAQAGEIAEPYRVLVIANFPVNFTEAAMRRLLSIVSSGRRCGVYTLISLDTEETPPYGLPLEDLETGSVTLHWMGDRFVHQDSDFGKYRLELEPSPPAELENRLIHEVGDAARDANRVEVPFDYVAPQPGQWWSQDSRTGIRVPLGRSGATKRQFLDLGQGTSHHVLIAGKTGSGKSTLLHALVTGAALYYSPDEVELYLVDFKKGVEFKTYATHKLPHARVVAIESEREFGLSVLQKLDAELRKRGDLFRQSGVHDVKGYRDAHPDEVMPRVLLIVDEFQEFFVEDDRIAQDAALLLDRLVRQGRAFGIHVLFGSQTLGGSYSLARSTIGQMTVRIALQCSESDAHLILSEENGAARLLSRPGEAIYNDANGLVEGNNPFQVVYLADDVREKYLQGVRELAAERQVAPKRQIVFEGNVPAELSGNDELTSLLAEPNWPAAGTSASAWLGEAIAIKDPTAATFRPQSGSHLLMIGQHGEAALGLFASSLFSLAAQRAPAESLASAGGARFYLLDGSPADSPHGGELATWASVLPHDVKIVTRRELADGMAEIAGEVQRRQEADAAQVADVYLMIYDLPRFRELRRKEDDFGFGRMGEDEPVSPDKHFAEIIREGPSVRVHTILWCDTLNNLHRMFDRQMLREFELRVLFQMSAADSSNLVDTPVASKLGLHRALFYSEEEGQSEKFRPYALPSAEWVQQIETRLGSRAKVPAREE